MTPQGYMLKILKQLLPAMPNLTLNSLMHDILGTNISMGQVNLNKALRQAGFAKLPSAKQVANYFTIKPQAVMSDLSGYRITEKAFSQQAITFDKKQFIQTEAELPHTQDDLLTPSERVTYWLQDYVQEILKYLTVLTPVDTGRLLASLYVKPITPTSLAIGFDTKIAPYAIYVHERYTNHPHGGDRKFLENAVLYATKTSERGYLFNSQLILTEPTLEVIINGHTDNISKLIPSDIPEDVTRLTQEVEALRATYSTPEIAAAAREFEESVKSYEYREDNSWWGAKMFPEKQAKYLNIVGDRLNSYMTNKEQLAYEEINRLSERDFYQHSLEVLGKITETEVFDPRRLLMQSLFTDIELPAEFNKIGGRIK